MEAHLKTVQLYKNAQHCVILYHIRKAVTSYNIHKTDLNELHYDVHIYLVQHMSQLQHVKWVHS